MAPCLLTSAMMALPKVLIFLIVEDRLSNSAHELNFFNER